MADSKEAVKKEYPVNDYVKFVQNGGIVIVNGRLSKTEKEETETKTPYAVSVVTANKHMLDKVRDHIKEVGADNTFLRIKDDSRGFSVVSGIPTRASRFVKIAEGVSKPEDNVLPLRDWLQSAKIAVCDPLTREAAACAIRDEIRHSENSKRKGGHYEVRPTAKLVTVDIPAENSQKILFYNTDRHQNVLIAGAFFLEDKQYKALADKLTEYGHTPIKMSTATKFTAKDYNDYFENLDLDMKTKQDANATDKKFNPYTENKEKIDMAFAAAEKAGTPVTLVLVPDCLKDTARESGIMNAGKIVANEIQYYRDSYKANSKAGVRDETFEYIDSKTKEQKVSSFWESFDNRHGPDLKKIFEEEARECASNNDHVTKSTFLTAIRKLGDSTPGMKSAGQERAAKSPEIDYPGR